MTKIQRGHDAAVSRLWGRARRAPAMTNFRALAPPRVSISRARDYVKAAYSRTVILDAMRTTLTYF